MDQPVAKISAKGRVLLSKAIRKRQGWGAGTRLTVEEPSYGVLLREEIEVPARTVSEVAGMLKYDGPQVSLENMDEAIEMGVKRRHDLGRY